MINARGADAGRGQAYGLFLRGRIGACGVGDLPVFAGAQVGDALGLGSVGIRDLLAEGELFGVELRGDGVGTGEGFSVKAESVGVDADDAAERIGEDPG